jgi:hypothetical protein
VNLQAAVVFNEAELPKLVHEETDPGPRRPDHLGQGFLTDPGHDELMLSIFARSQLRIPYPPPLLFSSSYCTRSLPTVGVIEEVHAFVLRAPDLDKLTDEPGAGCPRRSCSARSAPSPA